MDSTSNVVRAFDDTYRQANQYRMAMNRPDWAIKASKWNGNNF